jgi:hypothetical protein
MAGSLDGRARRVSRLEARTREPGPPPASRTQEEARALDEQIRELEGEIEAQSGDPDEWRRDDAHAGLSLEEQRSIIEKEMELCPEG